MYERNAIVLERFFNQMFGYNTKNNIKTNFNDYCELVEALEKYKNISEEEEKIIQEYDSIANKIREIQRTQENFNKKNAKMQEERANIFQSVGENEVTIQKRLDNININIENINEDIKENAQKFVDVVSEFNEKTAVRTSCGKTRRNLEAEYNRKLNETLDHYQDIDIDFEKKAKQFIEMETQSMEKEIKDKMKKNGEKEKIPFNTNVLAKAISLSVDIQKRETDILTNIYDKTNRLFTEIKNNTIKNDKHQKAIRDAKSKLDFISAIKEYLVQFLDNERLTAVNGEEEHSNLMKEACKNLDEDIIQINNLYTLLIKEGAKKITKKSYSELYNFDYLRDLERKAEEFGNEIKKLNLPGTIINPNYWRIEGMKKIYDVFNKCVTENYSRDMSEYIPIENEYKFDDDEYEYEDDYDDDFVIQEEDDKKEEKTKSKKDDAKTEIDKKIDKILGYADKKQEQKDDNEEEYEEDIEDDFDEDEYDDFDEDEEDDFFDDEEDDEQIEEEETEDEEDEEAEEDDDVSFDIWGNNINKNKKKANKKEEKKDEEESEEIEEDEDDDFDDDFDDDDLDDFDDDFDDDFGDDEDNQEDDDDFISNDDFDDEDENDEKEDDEIEEKEEEEKKENKNTRSKKKNKKENWEDEFVNIDKKEKGKKKKGFFEKFKK